MRQIDVVFWVEEVTSDGPRYQVMAQQQGDSEAVRYGAARYRPDQAWDFAHKAVVDMVDNARAAGESGWQEVFRVIPDWAKPTDGNQSRAGWVVYAPDRSI